jgi:hypothetical protein
VDKDLAKAFGRFDNGFTLTFENGLVLSTRFGPGNYCDNHAWLTRSADCDNHENWSEWTKENSHMASESMDNLFSDTVEVGVWDSDTRDPRNWVSGWQEAVFDDADPYDDVRGYVTMPEWLQIVEWCRAWNPE